jgi:hypothetical protein
MTTRDFPQLRPILAPLKARPSKEALKPLRQSTLCALEARFNSWLPSRCLANNDSKAHSRTRLLPLERTFWCWLWQIFQCNTSCREVIKQLRMLLSLQGRAMDENTSAYCQSRSQISGALLHRVYGHLASKAWGWVPQPALLQGRRLKALDGTSVRLPDTRANRRAFPQPTSQKPGAGFPVMKIAALFCVASGAILAHATGNLWTSEIRLAGPLLAALCPRDVLVVDRGFCSYALAALLSRMGVDVIARVPTTIRHIDWRQGQRLGPCDAVFVWHKPKRPSLWLSLAQWLGLPESLTVRVLRIRVGGPGVRVKELTLMTTLVDPEIYRAPHIIQAYQWRWRQEMCFDDIKTTLAMAHLKSQSPDMACKELCMFLIAHNMLRCLMAQAAAQEQIPVQRVSFKGALDGLRQCAIALAVARTKAARQALWAQFLLGLAEDRVPERPGRSEPRAVKRIVKYPKLDTHRKRYKERMSRNQRRRQANKRARLLN